jgi:hypothetical protein
VSSIITSVYYSWGSPERSETFREIIDHTLTVTDPYGYAGHTSTGANAYFNMDAERGINKVVGKEWKKVGVLETKFIFSLMGDPTEKYNESDSRETLAFLYPGEGEGSSDWNQLEKLPEGTVVSAYVSFAELMKTADVFRQFDDKDMDLLWLAVDTGEPDEHDYGIMMDPIGFPRYPIWHEDDMILNSREEKKGLFGGFVSESHSSPDYDADDPEIFHKQFMKTLHFIEKHKRIAKSFYFGNLELPESMAYLEKNGINHYGAVITGPAKEVLKLKDEAWIAALEVDEVGFWNWD